MIKYLINLIVILLTLIVGPFSDNSYEDSIENVDDNKQSIEQYIDEVEQLKEKIELLEEDKYALERQLYSSNDNFSNYIYNVFNPLFLHEGDKVLEYVVTKIEESDRHRAVEFSGELIVKLVISKSEDYTGVYDFKLSKEYYDKVPIDIFTYTKSLEYDYPLYYHLRNDGEEKLFKEIGDQYYDGIEVLVTLRNYTMIYDQSNFANWVEFIKLNSIVR